MHPSTKRTATIGGVASVTNGRLRDRGTVIAARAVACEETPRVVTLTGDAVRGVNLV